jgi:hypothetical protein
MNLRIPYEQGFFLTISNTVTFSRRRTCTMMSHGVLLTYRWAEYEEMDLGKKSGNLVGFEVLTAVSMKIAVFWVVAPCSLVEVYQRDGGSKDL